MATIYPDTVVWTSGWVMIRKSEDGPAIASECKTPTSSIEE
jgi:hypothetical protein